MNLFDVTANIRFIDAMQLDADSEWERLLGGNIMKIRIAIIVACAGMFALTQIAPAQAANCQFQYGHGVKAAPCPPKDQKQKTLPRTTQSPIGHDTPRLKATFNNVPAGTK